MKIISIDGGGFLGLSSATLVRDLENHFQKSCHSQFDLFCGTSTGAIIALGLASGLSGARLVELYRTLGSSIFSSNSPLARRISLAKSLFVAKYPNAALRDALTDAFAEKTLGDLAADSKRVLITAFCVTNGRARVFKTDLPPKTTQHNGYKLVDVALASSAAPTFFPMVKIPRPTAPDEIEVFCDGGVVANHPALLGFAEAIGQVPPPQIKLLSISTPRNDLRQPSASRQSLSRGLLAWAPALSSVLIDSGSSIMHESLKRIVNSYPEHDRPLYQRLELENKSSIPMDLASKEATDDLAEIGARKAASAETRKALTPFFN
jgi:uncharacterized protein